MYQQPPIQIDPTAILNNAVLRALYDCFREQLPTFEEIEDGFYPQQSTKHPVRINLKAHILPSTSESINDDGKIQLFKTAQMLQNPPSFFS